MSLLDEQPAPTPDVGDVWAEIIAETTHPVLRGLYEERRRQGIERHGVPLQRGNGRDHEADAIQELVDAICYLRAANRTKAQSIVEAVLLFVLEKHA
jgi:hypothetical protein